MASSLTERTRALNARYAEWIVDLRRRLHQMPELAWQEHRTAEMLSDSLGEIGLHPRTGVAGTGLVVEIEGHADGPLRILRADIDALPIEEQTGLEFCSRNPGSMHACGHDAHMASLVGAARILADMRGEFAGTVRCIFQPSEEKVPGGAPRMIEDGAIAPGRDGRAPTFILGQHVYPDMPTGVVGVRSGPFMASADEIFLDIRGEGGHAAHPERLRADAVLVQAHILTALQSVISRHRPPDVPSILSFGKVTAEGATNIIPETVRLEGTFRSMDEQWRYRAHDLIRRTAVSTAEALGAECDVEIAVGYPALVNDERVTTAMRSAAIAYLGQAQVVDIPMWYASEDFAYYTQELAGCFYVVGVRNEDLGMTHGLHTPRFTIDEELLKLAPGLMAFAAMTIDPEV